MKATACGVCGSEHWLREPHVWKTDPPTLEGVLRVKPVEAPKKVCSDCAVKDLRIAELEARCKTLESNNESLRKTSESNSKTKESNSFNKKSYMKSYMAVRRAVASGRAELVRRAEILRNTSGAIERG